jgi:tetratricopeptide (TPR) repeat protein
MLVAGLLAGQMAGCGRDPEPGKQELIARGDSMFYAGNHLDAIGPYKKAAERDPADSEVSYKIGQCYFYRHNYREAIFWYQRALKSHPGHRAAAAGLEEAKRRLPNLNPPTLPLTGPEPVNETSPRVAAEGYIQIAKTWEAKNDLPQAEDNYKLAVRAADNMAFTHVELGRFYVRTDRKARAVEEFKLALTINPNEPNVAAELEQLGKE